MPSLDQGFDQGDDFGDRLRGQWLVVGAAQPEAVGVLEVGVGHLAGESIRGRSGLSRRREDLVIDVGDVDDQPSLVAESLEQAPQQEEDHIWPRVADVDARVHGRPAGVDADAALLARLQGAQLTGERSLIRI